MKTIRFYDMLTDTGYSREMISGEFRMSLPEDIDLSDMFDVLSQKTGYPIDSFSYENVGVDN